MQKNEPLPKGRNQPGKKRRNNQMKAKACVANNASTELSEESFVPSMEESTMVVDSRLTKKDEQEDTTHDVPILKEVENDTLAKSEDENVDVPSDAEEADSKASVQSIVDTFANAIDGLNEVVIQAIIETVEQQCSVTLDKEDILTLFNRGFNYQTILTIEDTSQKKKVSEGPKDNLGRTNDGKKRCVRIMGAQAKNPGGPCDAPMGRSTDPYFCKTCMDRAFMKAKGGYEDMVAQCIAKGLIEAPKKTKAKTATKSVSSKKSSSSSSSGSESETKKTTSVRKKLGVIRK